MRKVEITEDSADAILRQMLVEDYFDLVNDIESMGKEPNLNKAQEGDLIDSIKYRNALQTLLEYYLPYERYLEVVGLDGG
jgi:hypothetical protein